MKNKRVFPYGLLFLVLLVPAGFALAASSDYGPRTVAEIVMFKSPKSAVTNVVHMTPSASGGWQCRIARETVDAFRLDRSEVTSPLTRARKGEAGYFVLGDGDAMARSGSTTASAANGPRTASCRWPA